MSESNLEDMAKKVLDEAIESYLRRDTLKRLEHVRRLRNKAQQKREGTMTENYKPQKKYDDANTIQIKLKLNKKTDADIIAYLEASNNKQGTIKALIRSEIEKSQG